MRCSIFSQIILDEEKNSFQSFGICIETEYNTHTISDITLQETEIIELRNRLRTMEVADCHIMDVVEDFISEINSL